MGLDMYLERRTYVKRWDHIDDTKQFAVSVTRGGAPYTPIKPERISYVIEEVGYWRKANQVHRWFVENVQKGDDDCEAHYVPRETLIELLREVNAVLDDPSKGPDLLPTEQGFFFGSTKYGEDYILDLQDTKTILEPLLEVEDDDADYYYRASW